MDTRPTLTLPDLPAQFLPPAGWIDSAFEHDGHRLAYGYVFPETKPDGVVVILPGRAEFREKYFETMRDLLSRNLAVFTMDWHGQGSSERMLSNPHKDHSHGFQHHVADLNGFIRDIVTPTLESKDLHNTPLLMLAHSMGGHIGLRYLLSLHQVFKGAVLASPMIGVHNLTDKPEWMLETARMLTVPFHNLYAHGGADWKIQECKPPGESNLSSDPLRDSIQRAWFLANPHLQLGHVTWGWIYHVLESCAHVNASEQLRKMDIPILFATAEKDIVVNNGETLTVASKIPTARQVEIPDARHEIMMERDSMRNLFFEHFDNFLTHCNIR